MDGAFDMMHYGHMNAFRQGKSLGTYLVVGVNSDESITACKGKPVTDDNERVEMVKGCRWVDEVVQGVPYIMSDEYLKHVIEKYRIDYVVHGDDPCMVDGKDVYESAQKMGKYLTIPRTEGISTTDIVGRMLLMTKTHHSQTDITNNTNNNDKLLSHNPYFDRKSNFLTSSRVIRSFSSGMKAPTKSNRIVYLTGAWDMFHAGHVRILEIAHSYGDYVIVGVYSDAVVNKQQGQNFPILNLHERVLSVMGCKHVDDVLFDAPYIITNEFLLSLNISVVVKGESDPTIDSDGEVSDYSLKFNIFEYFNNRRLKLIHLRSQNN